jgi:acetyltransferase-like isoleucine patch superfamily enzyme
MSGEVTIGENTFFGHGVKILTGRHHIELFGSERVFNYPKSGFDIVIGDGVWVCSGVIIISPCVIGNNSVIGAGSVVTKDIPANQVWAGNPAKYIRDVI